MDYESDSSRMIVLIYQTAWRHIPEAHNLIITVDLDEVGYEGVVLTHFLARGGGGGVADAEISLRVLKAVKG
jgi:hypothetical protein